MNPERSWVEGRARIHAALGEPARLSIVDILRWGDASPGEVGQTLGLPTNLVAHHVKVLSEVGLIVRTRSEGDRRRTYLRLVPETLTLLGPPPLPEVARVVFVCTHNSARSQLARALWAERSPLPAASAGTRPAARIHPRAIRVGHRHGLNLTDARTAHVDDVIAPTDLIVAVCDNAHENLPVTTARRLHWSIPDPAPADTDAAFETAYVDLRERVDRLATTVHPTDPTPGASP